MKGEASFLERRIGNLDALVDSLPEEKRQLFNRIFHLNVASGRLRPPETMYAGIEKQFGSVEAVIRQKIIKVTNLVTFEGALFNPLRASRPMGNRERLSVEAQVRS